MINNSYRLSDEQFGKLNELLKGLNETQLVWVSAYLDGLLASGGQIETLATQPTPAGGEYFANLTVLYGTETGNSQELAEKLVSKAAFKNIKAEAVGMYDYDVSKLAAETNVAVIVSTHGEGEVPEMAKDFYNYITGKGAASLKKVNFSVLALGDKTYKYFCKTGEVIYQAMKDLGAFSLVPLEKCDVDYEQQAEIWMNNFLMNVTPEAEASAEPEADDSVAILEYSKAKPFQAEVLKKEKLSGDESEKEVYHFEFSLEGSGLDYEPGDALGIYTKNPKELVDRIIEKTGFDREQLVFVKDKQVSVERALTHHVEITVLSYDLLEKYVEVTANSQLDAILDDDNLLDEYLEGHDLLDLLSDFPFEWKAAQLFEILRPFPPRLYSISSSQSLVGNQVHATIALVRYTKEERLRMGACSSHVIFDVKEGDKVPLFIDKNPSFKLPNDNSAVIMIGAGTGIAPYRAFMQQRENEGSIGKSWLFYGDRTEKSDFLYRDEWKSLLETGTLEKLDVAFSRDQEAKVYVQHKMKERQQELYEWLENGAYLYVCGDMKHMAKDVNETLLEIIQEQGGGNLEEAEQYLRTMKREKRYQTDVY